MDLFEAVATQTLDKCPVRIDERHAVCVMLVSGGYPGSYEKDKPMQIGDTGRSILFHAGTALRDGRLVTNGGRVLAVSNYGGSQAEALQLSMEGAEQIYFDGKYYRRDIGRDLEALAR